MSELLSIASIELDDAMQPRLKMNMVVAKSYAEDMARGVEFPPLVVFNVDGRCVLVDGFHRVAAARLASIQKFPCDVHTGSMRDAILYSCGSNSSHGLRRKNADLRRTVERLLADPEWSQWSNREIAEKCHVSNTFVGKCRGLTVNVDSEKTLNTPLTRKYTTKHGTTASMATENIGRKPASDDPTNPSKSSSPVAPVVDTAPVLAEPQPELPASLQQSLTREEKEIIASQLLVECLIPKHIKFLDDIIGFGNCDTHVAAVKYLIDSAMSETVKDEGTVVQPEVPYKWLVVGTLVEEKNIVSAVATELEIQNKSLGTQCSGETAVVSHAGCPSD